MLLPLDEPRRGVSDLASCLPMLPSPGFVAEPSHLDLASLRSSRLGMMEAAAGGGARKAVKTVVMEDQRAWGGGGGSRRR
ncbi:hypothetical protein CDL15_Pgr017714 [Punica granatum]|nr:hypothetical protein CDL15_Pgr017714 [Punica granatum]